MVEKNMSIIKTQLERFIELSDKYAKSFFWSVNQLNYSEKQEIMKKDSFELFEFQFENNVYEIWISLIINSIKYQFKKSILKNRKKTNIKTLRNILKSLE